MFTKDTEGMTLDYGPGIMLIDRVDQVVGNQARTQGIGPDAVLQNHVKPVPMGRPAQTEKASHKPAHPLLLFDQSCLLFFYTIKNFLLQKNKFI